MKQISICQDDFSQILTTAEILIEKVAQAFSQDEIVKTRVKDICDNLTGKTEADYNEYLKKRGVKLQN
jgi:hypothetical protein